jgi:L-seryl-tRNA(Ser) seleniumtransferase
MVLKVHRSNFAVRGFTEEPTSTELAAKLPPHIPLVVDQGSGVMEQGRPGETSAPIHIAQGAALVTFSGDKALGSVQAGCIVGKEQLVARLLKSPLYRVLRPGKTILTLLEHSLIRQLNGTPPAVLGLLDRSPDELRRIGDRLIDGFPPTWCQLVEAPMTLGGGSGPDEQVSGIAIRLPACDSPEKALALLREQEVPVIGAIEKKVVMLNLGAVFEDDVHLMRQSLRKLLEA